jgi:hypothetical protein
MTLTFTRFETDSPGGPAPRRARVARQCRQGICNRRRPLATRFPRQGIYNRSGTGLSVVCAGSHSFRGVSSVGFHTARGAGDRRIL